MDRTLVLLRHAKAARPSHTDDADRPLTDRGHADSAAAGNWLAEQGINPARVLCSPAARTRETWQSLAAALDKAGASTGASVSYDPELYLAYTGELINLIQATDPAVGVLLVIGHNPGISRVSSLLDPDGLAGEGLRTAGLAVHRVSGDWSTLEAAPRVALHTARG